MIGFLNFFKSVLSFLTVIAMFLTQSVNSVFVGDVYPFKSYDGSVGLETLARSQGVTTDGDSLYFSGKNALEKVDIETGKIISLNTNAITDEMKENYGSAHIGGISYHDGIVYAGVEDSRKWQHPLIVLYDADTLEPVKIAEMSPEMHTHGIPWVIADPDNNVIYAGDAAQDDKMFVYDLETLEFVGTFDFSEEIKDIQGGECFDGLLYLGTNDITRAVYTLRLSDGKVCKLFDRIKYKYSLIDNFGGEGEDLTVLKLPDGTFIHTLQLGALFIDSTLRHYYMS